MCNNFHDTWTKPKLILLSIDGRLRLLEGKGYIRNYTYISVLIQKNKQGGNGSGYLQEWMEMVENKYSDVGVSGDKEGPA